MYCYKCRFLGVNAIRFIGLKAIFIYLPLMLVIKREAADLSGACR
jgi:hypothetical protein